MIRSWSVSCSLLRLRPVNFPWDFPEHNDRDNRYNIGGSGRRRERRHIGKMPSDPVPAFSRCRAGCTAALPEQVACIQYCHQSRISFSAELQALHPTTTFPLVLTILTTHQHHRSAETLYAEMAKVAFVTGGNGITGSAIVEHLANNTSEAEWSRIIVTSRSPFQSTVQDPRIDFIALDFTSKPEELAESIRETCTDVTHAYFSSYVHKDDFAELNSANQALFENFLQSLLLVARKLQNVTLQTGGKYYNIHLGPRASPAREEEPRQGRPEDNFYFPQEDFLAEKQKGQQWTWNVVRPEAIIGCTSKPNGMNSALTYALYFLICKELGEEAKMPTNQLYWKGVETHSDAGLLARFTIWTSTNPKCGNEAFNLVDGDHVCPQYMWPRLAEWFGAYATSDQQFTKPVPKEGEVQQELSLADWAKDKRAVWDHLCDRAGVPEAKATFEAGTWQYQDWVFMRTWYPTLSMNKARRFGWTGHIDSYESLTNTFARLRQQRQIP